LVRLAIARGIILYVRNHRHYSDPHLIQPHCQQSWCRRKIGRVVRRKKRQRASQSHSCPL